jgi:hypothetical protein
MTALYLIWSNEIGAWLANPSGYTDSITRARRFPHDEAVRICTQALTKTVTVLKRLPEIPVSVDDLDTLRGYYVALAHHRMGTPSWF